ncbi:predicted protein [Nematostella vectensis]|uniref:Succinate dehydrogenase assembly factor 3, mitochondrial n=1 Tax=Nematostella vectensis TaxID=45351 RepID=SDHF3_NEMVE|nr:succinate dehydrogenase assembly factor 3, mitochondrial [Nematostella vectensis]A7S1H9.1 RecName: Full=Succinate dehydrogenase assembly factor 3, mitochondrial; Short=SDH assembly factor 3; Short=SDHAF3; Flags: Precursor [Nematostella vectensis]EDO42461.1 predicted protein [Nematostella vectensis]|eukprot:XP_001634524.1 predicted protein [Nematostella vectensis]
MSLPRHTLAIQALYRRVLKLHRKLPLEIKALGDQYAKDEFRRHKKASQEQAVRFMQEWKIYADTIEQQVNSQQLNVLGKDLKDEHIESLTEEQLGQLYSLQEAALKPDSSEPRDI